MEISWHMDFARHELSGTRILRVKIHGRDARGTLCAGIVLRQDFAQKLCRIEIRFRQIFPEKFAPPHNVAFAHGKKLERQAPAFAIITKNVDVAFRSRRHLLLLGKLDHGLPQIAILRGQLVTHVFRSMQHSSFQNSREFRVAAFQKHAHVAHGFLILCRRAQTLDAGAQTAFDVILQAWPRRAAIDFNVAGAQLEGPVY